MYDKGSKYMAKEAVNVLESQIWNSNGRKLGYRWNDDMKLFALRNFYYSPQGYKFLSQYFYFQLYVPFKNIIEGIRLHCGIMLIFSNV